MTGGDGKVYLESVFSNSRLTKDQKKEKMLEAVSGYQACLKALHDKDFKHGDIDIKNFFHDADSGRTAIGDFGSVRHHATSAQKEDEIEALGMMLARDIVPMAASAGINAEEVLAEIKTL